MHFPPNLLSPSLPPLPLCGGLEALWVGGAPVGRVGGCGRAGLLQGYWRGTWMFRWEFPTSVSLTPFFRLQVPTDTGLPPGWEGGKEWGSLGSESRVGRGSWGIAVPAVDVHFVLPLAAPSPGFARSVLPERHSHLQSYPVHLIPGLSGICWLTLTSFFQALLDFSPSRLPRQLPLAFHFPSSKSLLTPDFWWLLLSLSHCPCCLSGVLGRSGDKLAYSSACSLFILLLAASLLLGVGKAGNSAGSLWLCLHPKGQGKSWTKSLCRRGHGVV